MANYTNHVVKYSHDYSKPEVILSRLYSDSSLTKNNYHYLKNDRIIRNWMVKNNQIGTDLFKYYPFHTDRASNLRSIPYSLTDAYLDKIIETLSSLEGSKRTKFFKKISRDVIKVARSRQHEFKIPEESSVIEKIRFLENELDSHRNRKDHFCEETRRKMSESSLKRSRNFGFKCNSTYSSIYEGHHFDSLWELDFYRWWKEVFPSSKLERSPFSIEYVDPVGVTRKYLPDFVWTRTKTIFEVKGRLKTSDFYKWSGAAKSGYSIIVLGYRFIRKIRRGLQVTGIRKATTELNRIRVSDEGLILFNGIPYTSESVLDLKGNRNVT